MNKPKTLNELRHLEDSGFGKPYPRHGLKLLYWFANDCVYFNVYNNMCWQYDPEDGYFDFHLFKNRIERNGEKLLPDVDFPYYEVGNLSKYRADELPDYVLEDYEQNPGHCQSNMERIIISVDDEFIDRVYVTEHIDQSDFNKEATYCISRGLIKIIKDLTLEELLKQTGYYRQQEESDEELEEWTDQEESDEELEEWTDIEESDEELEEWTDQEESDEELEEWTDIEESDEKVEEWTKQEESGEALEEWTDIEESDEKLGEWTDQEESDQETEYLLNQREDTYWNYRRSGPVVEEDNESVRSNTVSEKCCKCVIL